MATQARRTPQTTIQEYRKEQFLISTDPARLDVDSIHAFLSRSYWDSAGIPREIVERCIRGSLCFGVYDSSTALTTSGSSRGGGITATAGQQVGFARVVTDYATFAYLSDDYIVETHRGRGLGKWLMGCILSHPDLQGLHRWVVVTRDPRLYQQVGFTALKEPETYLEIVNLWAQG